VFQITERIQISCINTVLRVQNKYPAITPNVPGNN